MEDTEPAAAPAATVTEPATTAEAEAPAPVAAPAKKRRVKQQTIGPGAPTADAPPPRFCPPTEPSRARRLEDGLGDDGAALATTRPPRWTHEEETSLRTLVGELGNDAWATIAARLGTGRTANGVEVKWRKLRAAGFAALPPSPQQVVAPPPPSAPDATAAPPATAPAPADDLVPSDSDEEFMAPTTGQLSGKLESEWATRY